MYALRAPVVCALLGLTAAASAFAQDEEDLVVLDIEDRKSELETQDKKLETAVSFETEWHEYDNLDFRALDESTDQAILDSDDRNGFAFTGISLELGYQIDKDVRLVVGTSYRGLWGNDQIGNVNRFGGFLYFTSLYAEYAPEIGKSGYKPVIRLGRQRFDIGGIGGSREYVLGDIVDQLRIDFPIGKWGKLITVPIGIVGLSADNDDVNFVGFIGQGNTQTFGFRGDRMTRRHGGILVINPEPLPNLDVRGYGFYTDVGALGSGSDITYNGLLGNFSDNDWVFNGGVRASYKFLDVLTPWVELAASAGIDRKELVIGTDANTNGLAWGAGLVYNKDKNATDSTWGGRAEVSYWESQGAAYQSNGLIRSHGYVGMKARHVGGLLTNRFLGWHPSAYVGSFGLEDQAHATSRKAGTRVVSASGVLQLPIPMNLGFGYWFLQDTGISALDQNNLNQITPPFGYSREEFAAQRRLGRVLGHEVNGTISVDATDNLRFFVQGAMFLPGAFYEIEIGRIAGTALGSSDPQMLWDASAGASVRF